MGLHADDELVVLKSRDAHGAMQYGGGCGEGNCLRHRRLQRQPAEHRRSYNPTTNTWTSEAPLLVGKSEISAGLLSTTIVASGGFASGGVTGDTEGYNATTNTWTALTSDSVHRNGACAGAISGNLYASDGNDNSNNAFSVNELFNLTKNAWTTLTAMPQTVTDSGPAVYNGQLYCFGGSSFANAFRGTVYNNVQIYQP